MPNDLPAGFVPDKPNLPPGFIPDAPPASKKKPETFWGNVKALFNPPPENPREVLDSAPTMRAPLGFPQDRSAQESMSEASALANLGLMGMTAESSMGMPKPAIADVTSGIRSVGRGLGNVRLRAPGPELGSLENPGPMSSLTESPNYARILAGRTAARLSAREALQGIPAQPLTESPNYPRILAARAAARAAAREALEAQSQTGAELPPLRPSGVLRIPEPREALPTDNPGTMYSVPRERLPGLALQGVPGAADVLRNTGQPIIYTVPAGYPGPRSASAIGEQVRPRVVVIRPAAD
jgi:hypothetical protein